ncbi:hypothetical protein EIP91_009298, partial [Steccherinum ochraceum]
HQPPVSRSLSGPARTPNSQPQLPPAVLPPHASFLLASSHPHPLPSNPSSILVLLFCEYGRPQRVLASLSPGPTPRLSPSRTMITIPRTLAEPFRV